MMPPGEYILNTRIQAVCQALATSDRTISSIAQMTGFFDHSHLTRQFVRIVGMTPREYRRKH